MAIKLKPIKKQVVVITGASSGIGLVTARMAARKGAKVVLAARNEDELNQLAQEIKKFGAQALPVAADVSNFNEVKALADAAIRKFGAIDTWVNNAGTSIFGEIKDVPLEEERKLFETNFWGVVYGSRVAAEHLRKKGGAIINLGSVASDLAIPLQAAYSASKHAIKAYTDTLRVELEHEGAPISVTLVKPTAIDTPLFRHAKTYMDAEPTEPSPMYAPEAVAEAIIRAAQKPMRDVLVGDNAPVQSLLGRLFRRTGDKVNKRIMFDSQKDYRAKEPGDTRSLDQPSGRLEERGGYPNRLTLEHSAYTKASMSPVVKTFLGLGAGYALLSTLRARRH